MELIHAAGGGSHITTQARIANCRHFDSRYELFTAIALMMGKIGHVWLAAHQVAINYATVAFMIP